MLLTENGIAMLSRVLNSKEAIQVNISIMRIFIQKRNFLNIENVEKKTPAGNPQRKKITLTEN